ncbi:aminoglycoside phosphotransferase family protein [Paenibacillus silvisoli]|uniref:aminoglycoside phosphotransferase family protein n=1 Tax=Paenibacillus silvisoli TaxID=3110539 RepID=UPI002804C7AE|nr:aminoglycoside phosphotransferase family protein [Paenibacillus silvisoli]
MAQEEKALEGGNVNRIVRVENTVRRPTGYWSPNVHGLLNHLEKQGFEEAPKFLGIDDSGREILTFLSGEAPGNKYPELEPYMWSDEALARFARLLRRYHDATLGYAPVTADGWQLNPFGAEEQEVICHNDAALYNVVFQDGAPAALIDFDMAGPGPRMWDIAYSIYTSVPLASFAPDYLSGTTSAYKSELHAADRHRRLQLFFNSYGISLSPDLKMWINRRMTALCDTLTRGAAQGNAAFQKMIDDGHLAHYEKEIQFVSQHFEEWT